MGRSQGLQTEILLSLLVVMVTATSVLCVAWIQTHFAYTRQLREFTSLGFAESARRSVAVIPPGPPGTRWWTVSEDGTGRPRGDHGTPMDGIAKDLASIARERRTSVLRTGPPWSAIRLAAPVGDERVVVAWVPPAVSPLLIAGLMIADVLVFTAFGAYLLRRRLVVPLQRVATAARAIADGATESRAPVDGVSEVTEVATAFNEMTAAVERRSEELEKAVSELRDRNRSLREARAGLDRAARLAAVGRLAAGVAHEVGNPMGAMLAFVDLAKRDPGLDTTSRSHLDRALREGERVRAILFQLLDFSRPQRGQCAPVDLRRVCEETGALIGAQRRFADIQIEVSSEGDPPPVWADPNGVAQIVLNLLLNAADAVTETAAPRIRVVIAATARWLREGESGDGPVDRHRFDGVLCRIEDNGPGVLEEDRERIFDPFFTTKEPGEGTGLGLSNALRLAEEFGGSLEFVAESGERGAIFALCLPAVRAGSAGRRVRGEARLG